MRTGEIIGNLIEQKGLNLRQLAIKAGIPYNTVYAIVKRKSTRIEPETLRRIAAALDVSPFYLLGDKSALSPSEIKASMGLDGYLKSLGYEFIEDYEYNGKECLLCIDRNQKKLFLFSEDQTSMLERSIRDFTKYTIAEFLKDGKEISDTDGWFSHRSPSVESTSPAPEGTGTDTTPDEKPPESP